LTKEEFATLHALLPKLYQHMMQHPNSMLCQFYGVYRMVLHNGEKVRNDNSEWPFGRALFANELGTTFLWRVLDRGAPIECSDKEPPGGLSPGSVLLNPFEPQSATQIW